jgi:FixJ family two-component response regulator
LELVVSGLSNKQVASELSIAEATVKIHRGQAMHKMHAGSLAELVRMASRMSLPLRGTGNDM